MLRLCRGRIPFMNGYRRDLVEKQDPDESGCMSQTMNDHRDYAGEVLCEPIVFAGCLGWYHPGSGQLGVVLCGPHG